MDAPPRLFDAHLHPDGLSDPDLETLRAFGVAAAVVVAHHAPQEKSAKALLAHFDDLVQAQLPRLERAGIQAWAALGVHPSALPRRGLGEVLAALPRYFEGGKVIALGEVGLQEGGELEEQCFAEHLDLARRLKLKVVVHTRARRADLARRTLAMLRASGVPPSSVLVDHLTARTVRAALECGHYAGLTLLPGALPAERAVALVRELGAERIVLDSDAGDADSDFLSLPRAAGLLKKAELSGPVLRRVTSENAAAFYGLSKECA